MDSILVGCGQIAEIHIQAMKHLGHSVRWVVGRNPEKTEAFAKKHGIDHFTTDLEQALKSDAAVAHICTPPTQHYQAVLKCLEAGKHVICEKPLSLSVQEAEELALIAQRSRLINAVCCNVRFYPANRKAAEEIRSGKIGRPLMIFGSYLQEFHAPPHEDGWRFDLALSGNQRAISEIGTHWIDLAYAWTGLKAVEVMASLGNWYPVRYRKNGKLYAEPAGEPVAVHTEDAAAVVLRFENGAIGTLTLSEVSRGHFNDLSMEISGTDGSFRWEELFSEELQYSSDGSMRKENFACIDRSETFENLFREVYAAIDGNLHQDYPTFQDGLYLAKACEAIRKSGETGEWTRI